MSYTDALVARLTEDAGADPARWADLVEKFPRLPREHRLGLVAALDGLFPPGGMGDAGRDSLWEALRALAARHRRYAESDWALPADETDALAAIADRIAPADSAAATRWLFTGGHPDAGGPELVDDFDAYDRLLADLRRDAIAAAESAGGFDNVRRLAAEGDMPEAVGAALAAAREDDQADRLLPMLALDPADAEQSAEARLAWGWAAGRFRDAGQPWADDACARELPAAAKARILLISRDHPRGWQEAERLGPDVAEQYWLRFNAYSLGPGLPHAEHVCQSLIAGGRVTAAVHLAAMTLRRGPDIKDRPAFLVGVLRSWIAGAADDPETASAEQRRFEEILAYLAKTPPPGAEQEVALLEWQLMPVLGYRADLAAISQALTAHPSLYVQVLNGVYRPRPGPDGNSHSDGARDDSDSGMDDESADGDADDERGDGAAVHGYRLLSAYRGLTGLGPNGTVDTAALKDWVAAVLSGARASGRGQIVELHVGEVLANAPADPDDGPWPCRPVRDLLEELQSARVERGLVLRVMNRRGVTSRGVEEGGAQETDLAAKCRAQASSVADAWPRSAAVLRALAQSYDADGRQQETSAERTRRGHDH